VQLFIGTLIIVALCCLLMALGRIFAGKSIGSACGGPPAGGDGCGSCPARDGKQAGKPDADRRANGRTDRGRLC